MREPATAEQIFSILSDRHSINIMKMAYSGIKASSGSYSGSISKKQFYMRLKRLRNAGLVEKRDSFYRTTTLGSLIYNSHVRTLENILTNYWNLKAIDVLKVSQDLPSHQKESVINEMITTSGLKDIVNSTHLSGFTIVKDFKRLINEVIKILDNARSEIFLATRYHDQNVSAKVMELFSRGVTLNILDGNPEQISFENRLNAVLRVPPSKDMHDLVSNLIRSPRFSLKTGNVPASFLVVDRTQVVYESINFANPDQFTIAISAYDDGYLAQRFIEYFKLLSAGASTPKLLASIREK